MTDVELQVLASPRLQALMDPHDLERLRRCAVLDRNQAFTSRLGPAAQHDYLAFVRMTWGGLRPPHDDWWRYVDLTDAALVAAYCASSWLGTWGDRAFNQWRRYSGGRTYPLHRRAVPEEDIATMMNHSVLCDPKPAPAASEARDRFAEATRAASFSLQLGVREIRLLAAQPWVTTRWLRPEYTAGMQRLIQKGLLIHEAGSPPRLSEAGELTRKLLVVSRHVVESDL